MSDRQTVIDSTRYTLDAYFPNQRHEPVLERLTTGKNCEKYVERMTQHVRKYKLTGHSDKFIAIFLIESAKEYAKRYLEVVVGPKFKDEKHDGIEDLIKKENGTSPGSEW